MKNTSSKCIFVHIVLQMRVLRDAEMVEALGSGMNRIMRIYGRENFEFGGNYIRMIVPYKWKENENIMNAESMDGTVNGTVNGTANGTANILVEKEKELLKMAAKYPNYSYEQYAELLHSSRRTIARMLKHLQEFNVVIRMGSDKNGYWEVIKKEN